MCMSLWCLAYIDVFYVFVIGETYVEGLKNSKVYISLETLRYDLPRARYERPKGYRDTALALSIDELN